MSETAHVLEELRALSSRLSDVYGEMRELVVELRHTQRNNDALSDRMSKSDAAMNERMSKIEESIKAIQLENATNKPLMDIAKRMYWSQWATIVAAGGGTIGINWTKFFGG